MCANEIDNMALIMPSSDKNVTPSSPVDSKSDGFAGMKGKKRGVRNRMESTTSLNVACLKRLLPIGLNMFGGQEQELVQQAKQRLIEVREVVSMPPTRQKNVLKYQFFV